MFKRSLKLPRSGTEAFFLWGPRQTGKTTLLESTYPEALRIDLLKAEEYRRYLHNPEVLRTQFAADAQPAQVVIDEIQKVPQLLDEVHWLHEHRRIRFALCVRIPGQSGQRFRSKLATRSDRNWPRLRSKPATLFRVS